MVLVIRTVYGIWQYTITRMACQATKAQNTAREDLQDVKFDDDQRASAWVAFSRSGQLILKVTAGHDISSKPTKVATVIRAMYFTELHQADEPQSRGTR